MENSCANFETKPKNPRKALKCTFQKRENQKKQKVKRVIKSRDLKDVYDFFLISKMLLFSLQKMFNYVSTTTKFVLVVKIIKYPL